MSPFGDVEVVILKSTEVKAVVVVVIALLLVVEVVVKSVVTKTVGVVVVVVTFVVAVLVLEVIIVAELEPFFILPIITRGRDALQLIPTRNICQAERNPQ